MSDSEDDDDDDDEDLWANFNSDSDSDDDGPATEMAVSANLQEHTKGPEYIVHKGDVDEGKVT